MSAESKLPVTVVVATYNRTEELRRLVDGLAHQDDSDFDVIVVDDGSDEPPTLDGVLGGVDLEVVRQSNAGPSAARHAGVSRATGDLIIVVDDDMIVPPGFVAAHRRRHEAGCDVAIGRYTVIGEGTDLLSFQMNTIAAYLDACEADDANIIPGRLSTGNVSFRRSLYERVGGFDLSLRRCEDRELGLRFADAGASFGFAHGADTLHADKPVDREKWLRVGYEYGEAQIQIAARHPDNRDASPWVQLGSMAAPLRMVFAAVIRWPILRRPLDVVAVVGGDVLSWVRLRGLSAKVRGLSWALSYFAGVVDASGGSDEAWRSWKDYSRSA